MLPTDSGEEAEALGAGVAVGIYGNKARAILESGAVINAGRDVVVHSNVEYPLLIDPISLGPFSGYYNPRLNDPQDVDFLGQIKTLIAGKLGLDRIVNVWVNTKTNGQGTADGAAAKVSLSGSIAVTDYNNISEAIIQPGVSINQGSTILNKQSLDVTADLTMEIVSVAGMFHFNLSKDSIQKAHEGRSKNGFLSNIFTIYGNSAGKVGVGGSVLVQNYDNATRAVIDDGAHIAVAAQQRLNLAANENIYTFEFVQAGGKSGNFGISGSISVIDQQSETLARIAPAVTIVAGSVDVNADNHTSHTNLVGAVQLAQAVGIGATAGLQFIERNTQAVVGSQITRFDNQAIRSGNRLRLLSHGFKTGDRIRFNVEDGATLGNLADGETYYVHVVDSNQIVLYRTRAAANEGGSDALSLGSSTVSGKYRLSSAGDAFDSSLFSESQVEADGSIRIPGHSLMTGDSVDYRTSGAALSGLLNGQNYFVTRVDADRVRLSLSSTAAEHGEFVAPGIGISTQPIHALIRVGSLRAIPLSAVIQSEIKQAGHLLQTGDLIQTKKPLGGLPVGLYYVIRTSSDTFKLAATAAKARAGEALTLNTSSETGPYTLEQVLSIDALDFSVVSKNDGNIVTVGLAAAIASKAKNATASPQSAGQGTSSGPAASVVSDNTTAKSSGVSIAGNATWHQLTDVTVASLNAEGKVTLTSFGGASVLAADDTSLYAIAGALALAKSDQTAVAIAGAFSRNVLDLDTQATLANVILSTPGDTILNASRAGELVAVTVGAAGTQISGTAATAKKRGVAIGGSVTWNTIDTSTQAVLDHANVIVGRSLLIDAIDNSKITAIGGGLALTLGGQLGLGAGVVVNEITTEVVASLRESTSSIDKDLRITATNATSIFGLAVSAGVGQIGVSGTFSVNEIQPKTIAEIQHANLAGIDAINVLATDNSQVSGDAGGVAVGLQKASAGNQNGAIAGAFGVAVAINAIGGDDNTGTYARVVDSWLNQAKSLDVKAISNATLKSLSLAGAVALAKQSGSQGGATALAGAGAGSQNIVATDIEATYVNSYLTLANSVNVLAEDHSRIHADAGGFNISGALSSGAKNAAAVGIGIGVAVNDLSGQTFALNDRGALINIGTITFSAMASPLDDKPSIAALAMGGGLSASIGQGTGQSGAFQGAGAITRNRLSRDIEASMTSALVFTAQSISVVAQDNSIIQADSGGVSIAIGISTGQGMAGSASVGVSVSRNTIGDFGDGGGNVTATITDANFTGINSLYVHAESNAAIDAMSISGTIAVSASTSGSGVSGTGAGADAQNEIRQRIVAEAVTSIVVASGDIKISADENSFIKSVVVGASVDVSAAPSGSGLSVAIGASVSNNTIANMVDAVIRGGSLQADGSVLVSSTSLATDRGLLSSFLSTQEVSQLRSAAGPVVELQNLTTLAQVLDGLTTTLTDSEKTPFDENLYDSRIFEPISLAILRKRFEAAGINLSERIHVNSLQDGTGWQVVDATKARVYHLVSDFHGITIRNVNVQSVAAAASVSVGVSNKGVTLSGGGASSTNSILSQTHALVEEADVNAALQLRVNATRTSSIASTVVAVSVTVGIGVGGASGAASIGAAVSRNNVGYDLAGTRLPAVVQARLTGGTIDVPGNLVIDANSAQAIGTVVVAASVAVSASTGGLGVGLGGAGASAINRIAADASAAVEGDGTVGKLKAGAISITARDNSLIRATAGAVAVAVAASADNAIAISIGVGLARNTITTSVNAALTDVQSSSTANPFGYIDVAAESHAQIESTAFAGSLAIGGATAVGVGVSGAGAEATNLIGTQTIANASDSLLRTAGNLSVRATNDSGIRSKVLSIAVGGGFSPSAGIGASIGAGLARNIIGQTIDDTSVATYTTTSNPTKIVRGNRVRIESGLRGGDVYEYISDEPLERSGFFDSEETKDFKWLTMVDYARESQWKLVNLKSIPSRVEASLTNVSGAIQRAINVSATSSQTIDSQVVAGTAGISGAGAVAASLSGAGVGAYNLVSTQIVAITQGLGLATSLSAQSMDIAASDESHIYALAGAASLSAAFSPVVGVSLAIGVSVARNVINNSVTATIVDLSPATPTGDIRVIARESSSIDSASFAASLAIGGGLVGIALSGAGADSTNIINNNVAASGERTSIAAMNLRMIAENTSAITSNVYAIAAAVSGGAFAGAGSIGVSIARNFIGTTAVDGARGQSSTRAYIANSNVKTTQDVLVSARSSESVRTNSVAGSVAIAAGIGLALAGAGAESTTIIAGLTEALLDTSNVVSTVSNIDVLATTQSKIVESKAVGAALAASVVGATISATVVRNEIANLVRATVTGDTPSSLRARSGAIHVIATTVGSAISGIEATNAAIAVGLVAVSGGGVDIRNTVNNMVSAQLNGSLFVTADGEVNVSALDAVTVSAEAVGVSTAIGLGAAAGVALVRNEIFSTISAKARGVAADATTFKVAADADSRVINTKSVGVGIGLVAASENVATSYIASSVKATIEESTISAVEVVINAESSNTLSAEADGGAGGGVAQGAMIARSVLGRPGQEPEVLAALGNKTIISAKNVLVTARGEDSLKANSIAGGGGAIAAIGAQSTLRSDQLVMAQVGDNVNIVAQDIVVKSFHTQTVQTTADAHTYALGTGAGAGVETELTGGAKTTIGQNSKLVAPSIRVLADNVVDKPDMVNSHLHTGSFGFVNTSDVLATTTVGTSTNPLAAIVDIAPGTSLESPAGQTGIQRIHIGAVNDISAFDSAEVEGGAGLAITTAITKVDVYSRSIVNLNQANLTSKSGPIFIFSNDKVRAGANSNALVFQVTGGAGAKPRAYIDSLNQININGGNVSADEVNVLAGRELIDGSAPSVALPAGESIDTGVNRTLASQLEASADTDVTTVSLGPSINIGKSEALVRWLNEINLRGNAKLESLRDVSLTAEQMDSFKPITDTGGFVLNIGITPYGYHLEGDGAQSLGWGRVNIDNSALVRGGASSQAAIIIRPVKVDNFDITKYDQLVPASQLSTDGLNPDLEYRYRRLNIATIPVRITPTTVVQVVEGASGGGLPGRFYRWKGAESQSIILEQENYANSSRWTLLNTAPNSQTFTIYPSSAGRELALKLADKFYVIANADLPLVTLTLENLGDRLLQEKDQILSWMASHSTNPEALARYQAQLDAVLDQIEELGIVNTVTFKDENGNEKSDQVIGGRVDTFFLNLPNVFVTPGRVLIEATLDGNQQQIIAQALARRSLVASAESKIQLKNQSPFIMVTGDAIVNSNRRVGIIEGKTIELQPGNVFFNFVPQLSTTTTDATISISSHAVGAGFYDLELPELPPQDLYIQGDVINTAGKVTITNQDGSIIVNGEVRGSQVEISAGRDFNLNTDGFLHTNRDPRQYLSAEQYQLVRDQAKSQTSVVYPNSNNYPELLNAINANESQIVARGDVNITARYLNINGLIQSGTVEHTLIVDSTFTSSITTDSFLKPGTTSPLPGISFGTSNIPMNGYFDADRKAIIVSEIESTGGNVRLTGKLFSTGNGRIVAAHGVPSVNIDNQSQYDLVIEGIDTTATRTGKVTLVDSDLLVKTEYVYNGSSVSVVDYRGAKGPIVIDGTQVSGIQYTLLATRQYPNVSQVSFYPGVAKQTDPNIAPSGLQYVWVDGFDSTEMTKIRYERVGFNLFGIKSKASDALIADPDTVVTTEITPLGTIRDLERSEYVSNLGLPANAAGNFFSIGYLKESDAGPVQNSPLEVDVNGWLRRISVKQTTTQVSGVREYFTYSLRADQPVQVSFQKTSTQPRINIATNKELLIEGNVTTTRDYVVNFISLSGSILGEEFVGVYGSLPILRADRDIDLRLEGNSQQLLDARSTRGNIRLEAISPQNLPADFNLLSVRAPLGDVLLVASGNLFSSDLAELPKVTGKHLELIAEKGAIYGTGSQLPLKISAGSGAGQGLSAYAEGLIFVQQSGADLRLAKPQNYPTYIDYKAAVQSKSNAVFIRAVNGSVVDGWQEPAGQFTAEQLDYFDNFFRLTGQAAEDAIAEAIRNEETSRTELYHQYWGQERQAVRGTPAATLQISSVENSVITTSSPHGLKTGDPIYLQLGFAKETINFATNDWKLAYDKVVQGAALTVNPLEVVQLSDGRLLTFAGLNQETIDPVSENFADPLRWQPVAVAYDLTQQSPQRLVLKSGDVVRTSSNTYRYVGSAAANLSIPADVALYVVVLNNTQFRIATTQTMARLQQSVPITILETGTWAALTLIKYNYTTNAYTSVDVNSLPQALRAIHESLRASDGYDAGYTAKLSTAEVQVIRNARFIDADKIKFPVTAVVQKELYPETAFGPSVVFPPLSNELPNIIGTDVQIFADQQIGKIGAATSIDFANGFSSLSDANKLLVSGVSVEEIVGRCYATYIAQRSMSSVDLQNTNFADTQQWKPLQFRYRTSQANDNVLLQRGEVVLVERAGDYGLYKFVGLTSSSRLSLERFQNNASRWQRIAIDFGTTDGIKNIAAGQVVQDYSRLLRATFQPQDDINVRASGSFSALAFGSVAIESDRTIHLEGIYGDDIRVATPEDITTTAAAAGNAALISDGTVFLRARSVSSPAGPMKVQLGPNATLGGAVSRDFKIFQVAEDLPFLTIKDLNISTIESNGFVYLEAAEGSIKLGQIVTTDDVQIVAKNGFLLDVLDIDDSESDDVNITANNAFLQARSIGKTEIKERLGVNLTGKLTAQAEFIVYIDSPRSLRVNTATGTYIDILADGDLGVGSIRGDSAVFLEASGGVIYDDSQANGPGGIDNIPKVTSTIVVLRGKAVGSAGNYVEVDTVDSMYGEAYVVAEVTTGSIYLAEVTGGLRIYRLSSLMGDVSLAAAGAISGIAHTSQDPGAIENLIGDQVTIVSQFGSIGTAIAPIRLQAKRLVTSTSGGNGAQYLTETDRVTAVNVNAGTSTVSLMGGEFLTELIQSNTDLFPGAILAGIGTVVGTVRNQGGTISPGTSPGVLSTGTLSSRGGDFQFEFAGAIPGNGGGFYDQLHVTGTVSILGSTLTVALLNNYRPKRTDRFILIDNDGSDPVVGTFSGLAEGAAITLGDVIFAISYSGGDGNDVEFKVLSTLASPPRIEAVWVDSSSWTADFRDYADGKFVDASARGYRLPTGNQQLTTLPWINIDRLKIAFSTDVGSSLNLSDFDLAPASRFVALGVPPRDLPHITGFEYDSIRFIVTLQLSHPFFAAAPELTVFADGVFDADGVALDGEWTNSVSDHSGDGISGGSFVFQFLVLPGDVVDSSTGSGTRVVNSDDSRLVRDHQNGIAIKTFGAFNYSVTADLDGNNVINATDSQYVRDQQNAIIFAKGNAKPGRNNTLAADTNQDRAVTPIDALLIINTINGLNSSSGWDFPFADSSDVSGDGLITPLDALLVINEINIKVGSEGEADSLYQDLLITDNSSANSETDTNEIPWFQTNEKRRRNHELSLLHTLDELGW